MPRTAIPVTRRAVNAAAAKPATTPIDPTNNHIIAAPCRPEQLFIEVANTAGADKVVTVKAGVYPPAVAAGQGDVTVTVTATTGVATIGPIESGRFLQADGSIWINVEAAMAGTFRAYELARG